MNTLSRFSRTVAVVTSVFLASVSMAEAKPKVALIMKSLANEFFLNMENGAKAHQKAHAETYELITNGIKDERDTANQIKIVEQMIAARVDAIVIAPSDSKALVPVVKRAIDAGIIVINIDNRFDTDVLKDKKLTVPFVGPDNQKGAKNAALFLASRLKEGDKVAIIEGIPTAVNGQLRLAGFKEAMAETKMNVVSIQSAEWEIDKATTIASAMLSSNPDLKAILAANDSMAIGAIAAIKAANKTGQVLVIGYDGIPAVYAMIEDDKLLDTVEQYPVQQVVIGIESALKALADKTPQDRLGDVIETPTDVVSKGNLEEIKAKKQKQ